MIYKNEHEEIEEFISNVDSVLNSNTFLLVIPLIEQIKDLKQFLSDFIKSKLFKELMIEQDKKLEWFMYSSYNFINDEVAEEYNYSGEFYRDKFDLLVQKISYDDFRNLLLNMLTTTKSFYRKQLPYEKANVIVNAFLDSILYDNQERNTLSEWEIYNVEPNFLNTSYVVDEDGGEEESNGKFPYFDDSIFDSCTVFYNKEKLYMLLTNGRP